MSINIREREIGPQRAHCSTCKMVANEVTNIPWYLLMISRMFLTLLISCYRWTHSDWMCVRAEYFSPSPCLCWLIDYGSRYYILDCGRTAAAGIFLTADSYAGSALKRCPLPWIHISTSDIWSLPQKNSGFSSPGRYTRRVGTPKTLAEMASSPNALSSCFAFSLLARVNSVSMEYPEGRDSSATRLNSASEG